MFIFDISLELAIVFWVSNIPALSRTYFVRSGHLTSIRIHSKHTRPERKRGLDSLRKTPRGRCQRLLVPFQRVDAVLVPELAWRLLVLCRRPTILSPRTPFHRLPGQGCRNRPRGMPTALSVEHANVLSLLLRQTGKAPRSHGSDYWPVLNTEHGGESTDRLCSF